MKIAILCLIALTTYTPVVAREVILLGAPDAREATPSLAVMSGGSLTLDVVIPSSLDRSKVSVGLWQTSGGLALSLGKDIALDAVPDEHGITQVRLEFPKVERKARVLVKFFSSDEPRKALGQAQVQVYPPFDWAPLSRKLKKDGPHILIFGENEALRAFFKNREIDFSDNGEDPPDRLDGDTLVIGFLPAKAWRDGKDRFSADGGRLLVFVADAEAPPGVYTQPAGAGVITKVTLPVLAQLAQDPRSEELLFQLFEQHIHTAPAANF